MRFAKAVLLSYILILGIYHFGIERVETATVIPDHKNVVVNARAIYKALAGRNRAYCIVNKTAWDLRNEGAGTFFKTGESSYLDRSSDIIIYKPNRETFDILGDAEGVATPQWGRTSPSGFGPIANWRESVDPTTILGVCPVAIVPVPPVNCDACKAQVLELITENKRLHDENVKLRTDLQTLTLKYHELEQKYNNVSCRGFLGLPCTVVKP